MDSKNFILAAEKKSLELTVDIQRFEVSVSDPRVINAVLERKDIKISDRKLKLNSSNESYFVRFACYNNPGFQWDQESFNNALLDEDEAIRLLALTKGGNCKLSEAMILVLLSDRDEEVRLELVSRNEFISNDEFVSIGLKDESEYVVDRVVKARSFYEQRELKTIILRTRHYE